jgi:hypothetical protein
MLVKLRQNIPGSLLSTASPFNHYFLPCLTIYKAKKFYHHTELLWADVTIRRHKIARYMKSFLHREFEWRLIAVPLYTDCTAVNSKASANEMRLDLPQTTFLINWVNKCFVFILRFTCTSVDNAERKETKRTRWHKCIKGRIFSVLLLLVQKSSPHDFDLSKTLMFFLQKNINEVSHPHTKT